MEVFGAEMLFKLMILALYVSSVDSVPSKCQDVLNSSDCGLSRTTVYTYDSPTAVCRQATWMGCPTTNKFDDEQHCLTACTKHVEAVEPIQESEVAVAKVKCDVLLNTNRCTKQMKGVYTYSNVKGACVAAVWFGCPSENLFHDISSCHRSCHGKNDNSTNNTTEESNTIKFPNEDNKIDISKDINDKAYFIYKLTEANKQATEDTRQEEDVNFILEFQKKYNVF